MVFRCGSQKCLAALVGLSLIAYNEKVEKIILKRKIIEQGLDATSTNKRMVSSNYLKLSQLQEYWGFTRLNHPIEATSMLYAIHEALYLTLDEVLDNRIERHLINKKAIIKGLQVMGLEVFKDENHQCLR